MMGLLKELALLKDLDERYEKEPTSKSGNSEFEDRQNRRREITNQIKTLGGQ
jgi:hypothetical protein